jgi:hypothetical protein
MQFFETIIGSSVRDALKGMHTMAFLLVCGSLVNNPEPSTQLLNVAKEYVAHIHFLLPILISI